MKQWRGASASFGITASYFAENLSVIVLILD